MFLFRSNFSGRIVPFVKSSSLLLSRDMSTTKKYILYGDEASPPVRFVMITASILKVDLEFRKVDLFKGENKTDFYKKINPLQKVPALVIKDEVICDSHAIALYLCRNSGNTDLYPKDNFIRARVDEMMYFHSSALFPTDSAIFTEFFANTGQVSIDDTKLKKWYSALDYLELKLQKQKFLAGNVMRLCDICCGTTVSSLEILVPVLEQHKRVADWLQNLKSLSCFEVNIRGLDRLRNFVEAVRKNVY